MGLFCSPTAFWIAHKVKKFGAAKTFGISHDLQEQKAYRRFFRCP